MDRFTISVAVTLTLLAVASCQLSCDSQLRLLPQFAHLFTHCDCTYNEWSEWSTNRSASVPTSQCPSGMALVEKRVQTVSIGSCAQQQEERTVCVPGKVEEFIIALDLGSTGHYIAPENNGFYTLSLLPINSTLPRPQRSYCANAQVCQHATTPHDRRSIRDEMMKLPKTNQKSAPDEPKPLPIDPIPFNIAEHGARYRRCDCVPDGIQHILFVLDTSGSIDEADFNRVTSVLSELVVLFCKPIKIAVMTFDHEYFVEFCFNCFDNTCSGRLEASTAMSSIIYSHNREGTRYTHTGGAAQCVCDYMLSPTCGIPLDANCVDVIFITDAQSNDPNRDVCSDILCLHNRPGAKTFAMGIGIPDPAELECITDTDDIDPNTFSFFNFASFDEFEIFFRDVVELLIMEAGNPDSDFVCINPEAALGTNGCF